jgi:hypothetical protein
MNVLIKVYVSVNLVVANVFNFMVMVLLIIKLVAVMVLVKRADEEIVVISKHQSKVVLKMLAGLSVVDMAIVIIYHLRVLVAMVGLESTVLLNSVRLAWHGMMNLAFLTKHTNRLNALIWEYVLETPVNVNAV